MRPALIISYSELLLLQHAMLRDASDARRNLFEDIMQSADMPMSAKVLRRLFVRSGFVLPEQFSFSVRRNPKPVLGEQVTCEVTIFTTNA